MFKKLCCYAILAALLSVAACKKGEQQGAKDFKTLGLAAHDLLSADSYPWLVIELSYMPGYTPDPAVLSRLRDFLDTYIHKTAGITFVQHEIPASGEPVLALSDIVNLEKSSRTRYTENSELVVHVLISDGYYTDSNTLATSYWNTSICMFGGNIDKQAAGLSPASKAGFISALLAHEFGHLMGLVDQGSPMTVPHRDAANGAHCDNSACLMYHTVEAGAGSTGIPTLDANCVRDLRANGGK